MKTNRLKYLLSIIVVLIAISCKEDNSYVISEGVIVGGLEVAKSISPETDEYLQNSISADGASVVGQINNKLGVIIQEYGAYCSEVENFSVGQAKKMTSTNLGKLEGFSANDFSVDFTGLKDGVTYYYKFYVKHSGGLSYSAFSKEVKFNTQRYIGIPRLELITKSLRIDKLIVDVTVNHTGSNDITSYGVRYGSGADALNNKVSGESILIAGKKGLFSVDLSNKGIVVNNTYYFQAYAENQSGEAVSQTLSITIERLLEIPSLSTQDITVTSPTSVEATFKLDKEGFGKVTEYGYYLLKNRIVVGQELGDGKLFTIKLEGLIAGDTYTIRPFAVNEDGESESGQRSFESGILDLNYADTKLVYQELAPMDMGDKKLYFLDRNLGSSKRYLTGSAADPATDAGWAFQWGRNADGHQKWTSATITLTGGSNKFPLDDKYVGKFITNMNGYTWIQPIKDPDYKTFWSSTREDGGINNPCPKGYRVPTIAEFAVFWANRTNAHVCSTVLRRTGSSGAQNTAEAHWWTCDVADNVNVSAFQVRNTTGAAASNSAVGQGNFVRCVRVE